MVTRGIAIVTYNRAPKLSEIMKAVEDTAPEDARLVVADDGSTDDTYYVAQQHPRWTYITGSNKGVAANKNRALLALQDCDFICLLEDDLMPVTKGWFEMYERALLYSGIHHFCRVQDKIEPETIPSFSEDMEAQGFQPIYGPSPRGDFTFISKKVVAHVGGLNAAFKGAGHAHGEWSRRIVKAGLVPHPNEWVDIREDKVDPFKQIGDTTGGRWDVPEEDINAQIQANRNVLKKLNKDEYIYTPIVV